MSDNKKHCPVCYNELVFTEERTSFYLYSTVTTCECGYCYSRVQGDTKETIGPFSFITTYDGEYFRNYPFSFSFICFIYSVRYDILRLIKLIKKLANRCCNGLVRRAKQLFINLRDFS